MNDKEHLMEDFYLQKKVVADPWLMDVNFFVMSHWSYQYLLVFKVRSSFLCSERWHYCNTILSQQLTCSLQPEEMIKHLREGLGSKGQVFSTLFLQLFVWFWEMKKWNTPKFEVRKVEALQDNPFGFLEAMRHFSNKNICSQLIPLRLMWIWHAVMSLTVSTL